MATCHLQPVLKAFNLISNITFLVAVNDRFYCSLSIQNLSLEGDHVISKFDILSSRISIEVKGIGRESLARLHDQYFNWVYSNKLAIHVSHYIISMGMNISRTSYKTSISTGFISKIWQFE